MIRGEEQRAHRRPHPLLVGVVLGDGEDHVGRGLHGALEQPLHRPHVVLGRPLAAEALHRLMAAADHAHDGVHRLAARDLAGGVATHPIGDHVEAELVVEQERVLVGRAPPADVGDTDRVPMQRALLAAAKLPDGG